MNHGVPIYGIVFRILTRFHALYFGALCVHRKSIVWRRVNLARLPYLLEKRTRRISRYSYLLEAFISSEYGLTISDCSRDSAPPMAVGEKRRLNNKKLNFVPYIFMKAAGHNSFINLSGHPSQHQTSSLLFWNTDCKHSYFTHLICMERPFQLY